MNTAFRISFFVFLFLGAKFSQSHTPTWTDGIACIVYSHCTSCHNPNGIAPFSLTTYNDVYQNRYSIASSVQNKSMPPFPASQEKVKYAHANTLTDHEIDELVYWVNSFAPLGDADNVPEPPTYTTAYEVPEPDFTAQIPTYTVTSTKDVYRVFVLPVNNISSKTIESIEVFPGNREVVHHALVFHDTSTVPLDFDLDDPLPGYSAFGGTGSTTSKLLTAYTPGQGAFTFAPGFGVTLLPNSYIVVQIHYPAGVSGSVDSTQIRIKYASSTLRNVTTIAALNHGNALVNGPLFIPADSVKTFYSKVTNTVNRTLTGIMPHMHLIGTSIKAFCVTPSFDTIHLVDIPDWDFHWQYFYQFQKPVFLPAGSIVYGIATYDNTSNNFNNPNDPPLDVSRGEGTEDEMFLIYMNLSTYQAGDTSIIIDTSSHLQHDAACFKTTSVGLTQPNEVIQFYPNPHQHQVFIKGVRGPSSVVVYAQNGETVMSLTNVLSGDPIDISNLSEGIYYAKVVDGKSIAYRKIVRQ